MTYRPVIFGDWGAGEDCDFQASLDYIVTPSLNKQKSPKKKWEDE